MCTVWRPQAIWFSLQFQDRQNVEAKILDSRHESPSQVSLPAQAMTRIPLWSSRQGLNTGIWVIRVIWVINWSDLPSSDHTGLESV